ncbi:D-aminoacylase [Caulobacter sp. 602-2]|uniref:D-aminoacylase n=1 Tax=Caulobacter sp. 602-2 TaxID=2710887 RepID=A0A6G4QT53_9CAUL|nr:D-aminoacylase [Caulobacter sp. 602-2]NGM48800.1 D-aminoacylase [Caulobacter sp. 602-2]
MASALPAADIVLKGGTVIDGSGGPAFVADVALAGDMIVAVSPSLPVGGARAIDVSGLVVAPGFIDVHTHDDLVCITQPDMLPKISQGVTTVIAGNCGISAPMLRFDEAVAEPFNLLGAREDFAYAAFADYRRAIEAACPRINVAALVGHSTLRVLCMDDLERPATAAEREAMDALLRDALSEGALGMSSGVFYAPAWAADMEELQALARTVAQAGGVYTAHIRDEREGIIEALKEAFAVAAPSGAPLILSHHKCAGVRNWGRAAETLGLIDQTRQSQPVHLDCYPYTAGSTIIRPDLADGEVEILVNWSEPHPEMAGRTLAAIAAEWGLSQPQAAERLMPGGASYFQMAEADMRSILAHPCCMVGSDGLPHDKRPHPRLWGAFPRVLGHYARDEKLISLEAAVHKMTGLAADTFRLAGRGRVVVGMKADLTVFDAETIIDQATYEAPTRPARGVEHVFVNGALAWSDGDVVGERAGRFLRSAA